MDRGLSDPSSTENMTMAAERNEIFVDNNNTKDHVQEITACSEAKINLISVEVIHCKIIERNSLISTPGKAVLF